MSLMEDQRLGDKAQIMCWSPLLVDICFISSVYKAGFLHKRESSRFGETVNLTREF